jgi:hypothetical protein
MPIHIGEVTSEVSIGSGAVGERAGGDAARVLPPVEEVGWWRMLAQSALQDRWRLSDRDRDD